MVKKKERGKKEGETDIAIQKIRIESAALITTGVTRKITPGFHLSLSLFQSLVLLVCIKFHVYSQNSLGSPERGKLGAELTSDLLFRTFVIRTHAFADRSPL